MTHFVSVMRASCVLLVVMTLLLGVVYPLTVTVLSQLLFHDSANGRLVERGDKPVGSLLLGQRFKAPRYFWSRLSATTPPYNAAASTGSNLSPDNPKLLESANARIAALQKAASHSMALIPVDLITSSASGLDPHISLDAALYQLPRVAKARGMKEKEVLAIVERHTEAPLFGLGGEPYVNVLALNLALDEK